jgi:hypothetical protein
MKTITGDILVDVKRWFQKSYGNTYHSVTIYVNDEVLRTDFEYGYGRQYLRTAHTLLTEHDYDVLPYNKFINSVSVRYTVEDVKRKKDL